MTHIHDHSSRRYDWAGRLSERRAALSPDRIGLVDATTGRAYSYADLDRRANRAARLLETCTVGADDRVAVVSRNRPALVDLYFATAKQGAILSPLSYRLAPTELSEMLADIEPTLLLVETPFITDVRAALEDCSGWTDELTVLELAAGDSSGESTGSDEMDSTTASNEQAWPTYMERLPEDDSPVDTTAVALSDPHLFLHTGGSTGLPKQVIQTHGNILWNTFNTVLSWGLRPDDVTPMVFPMFHTGGWNVLTIPLFHLGGTVIISREFDAGEVLSLVESHSATVLVSVPTMLRFMIEHDDWVETDISSLRMVKSGGGPSRESVVEAWRERGITPSQGYGLTECGPNNFAMPDEFPVEKTASIGIPALYVDARVVDEDGEEVPVGEIGELELASPHAADGYWRREAETEATFGDDWVSTGDLARIDEAGYYYIEGRKKNMFVSGGENVFPPEVEDVITDHPKVTEAIVVPIPDETWGQVGKAVIEGENSLTLVELETFLTDRIASFKIPSELAFVDEMPTSGPGKIDREQLLEAFGADSEADTR